MSDSNSGSSPRTKTTAVTPAATTRDSKVNGEPHSKSPRGSIRTRICGKYVTVVHMDSYFDNFPDSFYNDL
jgi:hypothetical protein